MKITIDQDDGPFRAWEDRAFTCQAVTAELVADREAFATFVHSSIRERLSAGELVLVGVLEERTR